jgi:hypothetical protein
MKSVNKVGVFVDILEYFLAYLRYEKNMVMNVSNKHHSEEDVSDLRFVSLSSSISS